MPDDGFLRTETYSILSPIMRTVNVVVHDGQVLCVIDHGVLHCWCPDSLALGRNIFLSF